MLSTIFNNDTISHCIKPAHNRREGRWICHSKSSRSPQAHASGSQSFRLTFECILHETRPLSFSVFLFPVQRGRMFIVSITHYNCLTCKIVNLSSKSQCFCRTEDSETKMLFQGGILPVVGHMVGSCTLKLKLLLTTVVNSLKTHTKSVSFIEHYQERKSFCSNSLAQFDTSMQIRMA